MRCGCGWAQTRASQPDLRGETDGSGAKGKIGTYLRKSSTINSGNRGATLLPLAQPSGVWLREQHRPCGSSRSKRSLRHTLFPTETRQACGGVTRLRPPGRRTEKGCSGSEEISMFAIVGRRHYQRRQLVSADDCQRPRRL